MLNNDFMALYEDVKKQKLGENIKNRRLELGLSVNEVAEALGITPAEFRSYEYGAQEIYLDMALKICNLLQADMDYFAKGIDKITVREVLQTAL